MAPTVATIPAQSLTAGGDPLDVNLLLFFMDPDGDVLTFSNEASSDTAVATVALSGSTLTITAVAAGTSTISVTATDPGGLSATGSVMLTVSEPAPMNLPPDMMTIGDDPVVIELGDNERLTSSAPRVVSVEPGVGADANKWTVRAEAKGSAIIRYYGADGVVIDSVEVTVPNQAPMRTDTPDPRTSTYYALTRIDTDGADDYGLSTTDIFLEPFFTDPDGDPLKYTFTSQSSEVLFVKAKNTAAGRCCTIYVDVLGTTHESASIVVHASDSEGEEATGTLDFQVGIADNAVIPRTYKSDQQADGDLATIVRVELRKKATTTATPPVPGHVMQFIEVDIGGTVTNGFKFAADFDVIFNAEYGAGADHTGTLHTGDADPTAEGTPYFTVTARKGDPVGSLVLNYNTAAGDPPPSLNFQVTKAGNAVVTVTYHVWDLDLDGDADPNEGDAGWRTVSETVNIQIVEVPAYSGSDGMFPE